MSDDVEIELKLALADPEQLGALLAVVPAPTRVLEQRNHYLTDPDGALAAARIMLRVRERWEEVSGERRLLDVVMTAKRKRSETHGVFVADEHEHEVALERWRAFGEDHVMAELEGPALSWVRGEAPVSALRVQGAMTNRRHEVPLEGFTLEIDRTEYPDGSVDAEVEVETRDSTGARALLDRLAELAGVRLVEQRLSKYERFLARGGAGR